MLKARSGLVGGKVARLVSAIPLIVLGALLAALPWRGAAQTPEARAALPPAELFFRLPEIGDAQLSPSGSFLAVAAPVGRHRRGLAVLDLEGQAPPRLVAGFADRDVGQFHWVGNEVLVYSLFDRERGSGDQQHGPGLFAVQRDGSGFVQLINLSWERPPPGQRRVLDARHVLLHVPAEQVVGEESVIVGLIRPDARREFGTLLPKRLMLGSGPRGEATLRRFDEARGAPASEPLVDVPGFDFEGELVHDPDGGEPLGVRAHGETETTVWTDAGMAAVQRAIDQRLPGRVNRLECRRCRTPQRLVLVTSYGDQHPGEFWIWRGEAAAPTLWRPIGRRRPAVDPARMARVDFHRFRARDGLEIPLWITTPAGTPPDTRLPTVLLAHGGPWVRGGHWGWDDLAQFLASRGYRALMPEFRSSTGYGWAHHRAGWRQWGQAMQDDLVDAVDWAAGQRLVDPQRVCIAGASYGGYAALMGVVRDGSRFRCAAAWVAVTDPRLLFEHRFDSDSTEEVCEVQLPRRLADPDRDAELLREISPVVQAARIRAPLLLAWGDRDRRVPLVHGERLQRALRDAGHTAHEVAIHEGEGHSWLRIDTYADFMGRLERFLARELLMVPPVTR